MDTTEIVKRVRAEYGDGFPQGVWAFIIEYGEEIEKSALTDDELVPCIGWALAYDAINSLSNGDSLLSLRCIMQMMYSLPNFFANRYLRHGYNDEAAAFLELQNFIGEWATRHNLTPLYSIDEDM